MTHVQTFEEENGRYRAVCTCGKWHSEWLAERWRAVKAAQVHRALQRTSAYIETMFPEEKKR